MLKLRTISIQLSLLLFSAVILNAQNAVATLSSGSQSTGPGLNAGVDSAYNGVIASIAGTNFGPLGQPFSADVIDETDKFLADGNHIHRETHGKIFCDSQGRRRVEREFETFNSAMKGPVLVTIWDPLAGQSVFLNLEKKTATVTRFNGSENAIASSVNTPNQKNMAVPRNSTTDSGSEQSKTSVQGLGIREIEGFSVTGSRRTTTIPAGAMGNDQPLTTSMESWHSSDLNTEVLSINENPESGKRVHKLVNIHTGNPDPLLFQVPADFTVKDSGQQ